MNSSFYGSKIVSRCKNFAAIRSLITTGIQKGHMKMHVMNILNTMEAVMNKHNLVTSISQERGFIPHYSFCHTLFWHSRTDHTKGYIIFPKKNLASANQTVNGFKHVVFHLLIGITLALTTMNAHAGPAGDLLKQNKFSQDTQEAADAAYDALKVVDPNYTPERFIGDPDAICSFLATRLSGIVSQQMRLDPTNPKIATFQKMTASLIAKITKECNKRKLNLTTGSAEPTTDDHKDSIENDTGKGDDNEDSKENNKNDSVNPASDLDCSNCAFHTLFLFMD